MEIWFRRPTSSLLAAAIAQLTDPVPSTCPTHSLRFRRPISWQLLQAITSVRLLACAFWNSMGLLVRCLEFLSPARFPCWFLVSLAWLFPAFASLPKFRRFLLLSKGL